MKMRNMFCVLSLAVPLSLSACGTAPGDNSEQSEPLQATSWALPVTLRLTSITMPVRSNNPSMQVNAYVTLPGLTSTRSFIGYYAPAGASDLNSQFNCSTVHPTSPPNATCTANLPLNTTIGSVKFTGTFPANSTSAPASVTLNGTKTSFTIDSTGHASQTCASTWMYINNIIDGDKVTVCWQVTLATPFTSPPLLETVFYLAPGEESSVGLQQSNSISTKTSYGYQNGSSISFNVKAGQIGEGLSIQGSQSVSAGQTITSGSSTGFTVPSTAMSPDPNNDLYEIILGANSSWTDLHDGSPPSISTDLSSGHLVTLTFGQLKGLATTPQNLSTIPIGDQAIITKYITPSVAQQFVAQDPFASSTPLAQTIANNPKRFQAATPAQMTLQRRPCSTCGDPSASQTQVHGSGTDMTVGQTTGDSFTFTIFGILGAGGTDSQTITTTYSDTNQSTASITLKTHNLCVEGAVDLYMDKAFGTIVTVPHLEDSCNSPTNCPNGHQRVLLPQQSLVPGQSLTSCNGLWTLSMQPDGMLDEFYVPDGSLATSFWTPGAAAAWMQSDGNFVVYDPSGNPLAYSGTSSTSGAYLILQDDGTLDIYNPLGNPAGGIGGAIPALWTMFPGG